MVQHNASLGRKNTNLYFTLIRVTHCSNFYFFLEFNRNALLLQSFEQAIKTCIFSSLSFIINKQRIQSEVSTCPVHLFPERTKDNNRYSIHIGILKGRCIGCPCTQVASKELFYSNAFYKISKKIKNTHSGILCRKTARFRSLYIMKPIIQNLGSCASPSYMVNSTKQTRTKHYFHIIAS